MAKGKRWAIGIGIGVALVVTIAVGVGIWWFCKKQNFEEFVYVAIERPKEAKAIYSNLTGLKIADASLNSSPTYCIQIPNGSTDGARPQAGLKSAAVVFEAIAETGITRFAAVFQNADISAIGPIRSLRPYYLDWDTPFDCTVVHAGGSDEAIKALRVGGQRELNESYAYMWRENNSGRAWNNLFTSPDLLNAYNQSRGWVTSQPKVFQRLTPDETAELFAKREDCANGNTESCESYVPATNIQINFSTNTSHNVIYHYDVTTNTYLRSHQDGKPHLSYDCPVELNKPNTKRDCGEAKQVAPNVVIAIEVQESNMADNYHQSIKTIGSGKATIFQNGEVIKGTWAKNSQKDQIIFRDDNGTKIRFTPGQIWISAVPQYGIIKYQ